MSILRPDTLPHLLNYPMERNGASPAHPYCRSNTPLVINALIDSGATGKFIDVDYVRSKNLRTQCLPRAIPVYNVDGTLNDAGYITEVIDLMVQYGDHSE